MPQYIRHQFESRDGDFRKVNDYNLKKNGKQLMVFKIDIFENKCIFIFCSSFIAHMCIYDLLGHVTTVYVINRILN